MTQNVEGGFTAGLDFTVHTRAPDTPAETSTCTNVPQSPLPSVASILATPAIPSLQQLRSSSLFPHGNTPCVPSVQNANLVSNQDESSIYNAEQPPEDTEVTTGTSVLAADLAAAIMSQLVTSSPTPVVTTTAQTVGEYFNFFISSRLSKSFRVKLRVFRVLLSWTQVESNYY